MGQGKMYLWALAGAYLVYLGIQQLMALVRGEASIPWLNGAAGILFIVFGGAVLLREWRAYRGGNKKDSEAPEEASEEYEQEDAQEGAEEA